MLLPLVLQASAVGQSDSGPFLPTGIASDYEGSLFVSDPTNGTVHVLDGERYVLVDDSLHRPWGLAVLEDGRLCVSHFTSEDRLRRRSAVSCREDGAWVIRIEGVGNGINGIAAHGDALWLAAWQDSPIESRNGLLVLLEGGQISAEIPLQDTVPQFIHVLPDESLLVSTWEEDASGYTGGRVLSVSVDGAVATFAASLDRPAGIAYDGEVFWVADYGRGALVALDGNGLEVSRHENLHAPLGVDLLRPATLCVAESRAERIQCLDTATTETRLIPWR